MAAGDAFSHYALARSRKIRGDRAAAEALYRSAADRHSGCAHGLGGGAYTEAEPFLRKAWGEGGSAPHRTEAAGCYGLVPHRLVRLTEAVEPLRTAAARWDDDVRARHRLDDLTVLARTADPARELAEVETASAAGQP